MPCPSQDIFDFWAVVPGDACEHPDDRAVLRRVQHQFQEKCLPGPFKGKLRSAPVVLLFLSPGFAEGDLDHALSSQGRSYYQASRTGYQDLPSEEEHSLSAEWTKRIVRQFGIEYEAARSQIAFLNISPYKSKSFRDWPMLSALPSCRAALNWAQQEVFPDAEGSRRAVVCLRSARFWGLERGDKHVGTLFAPPVKQGGIMVKGPLREKIVEVVRNACVSPFARPSKTF